MSEKIKKTLTETEATAEVKAKTEAKAETAKPVKAEERRADDPVVAKLLDFKIDLEAISKIKEDLGVDTVEDLAMLEVADLTGVGVKLIQARKLLAELKKEAQPAAKPLDAALEPRAVLSQYEALLPAVPSDESWLNALKTGGVLKVDESSYIAAIRAALADRAGLYDVPVKLVKAMEDYANETEEQVDPAFYKLRKLLTRRTYGDIFEAIDGLDGTYITDARRKEFLSRVRDMLWPAIADSYRTLDNWYQVWRANALDPFAMVATIGSIVSGGTAGVGAIATPVDTAQLHDVGDELVNSINRVFRGTGVQVAAAMAYDANTIRDAMEDTRLPSLVGVKNREMMLKKIGTSVSSNYIRLEQNLVKYVLGFVKHDMVTSDVEANYFVALWQLGTQINWNELGISTDVAVTGLGGKNLL